MKKKILSLLLSLVMLLSLLPVSALAAESFSDTSGHWAADAIDRWSGYGVVNGKDNGSFDPNGQMTRAEAAQVFANLLGLNKEGDISAYPDAQNDWFSSAIAKCVAAGILNGKGEGKMDPNGTITREEFLTMYARAVCLSEGVASEDAKSELAQKGFTDTAKVSDWAADSVKTLVDKGYVNGVSSTELAPQNNIDRASVMALLNQSISTYVGKNSTETTVTAKSEGITLIANPAVTDVTGTADVVVVAAGAEQYDKTTGEIEHNDIRVESAKMPIARVQGENITVTLAFSSEVQDAAVTSTGEKSEIVVEKTAKVGKLTIAAESAKATVAGTVETVAVAETAKDATVDTKSTAKVETVENKAENTTVTGSGTVSEVKSSEDVKVETENTAVANTNETKEIAVTDSKGTATKVETTTNASAGVKTETTVNQPISTGGSSGSGSSAHSHTYSADWTYDDTYHWHAATCAHTSEVSDKAAHVYANQGDTVCSVCHHGAVAIIGNVYYGSLDTALTSVKAGETITLLKDYEFAALNNPDSNYEAFVLADNVTLDLNGKTLTCPKMTCVLDGKNLTIQNGTFASTASYPLFVGGGNEGSSVIVKNVTVNGGINIYKSTVTLDNVTADASTKGYYAIWAEGGSVVTVLSGDYKNGESGIIDQDNSTVSVTGGTFSTDPSTYVASGYAVKYDTDSGKYMVEDTWANHQATDFSTPVTTDEKGIKTVIISSEAELSYFAAHASDFNGKNTAGGHNKVILNADLDLKDYLWTPINIECVDFDGGNHTIKNVTVTGNEYVGLFGYASISTVKDLTVDGAAIVGHHYGAVIAGHGLCGHFINCTAKNATVTLSVKDNDNGDKAGAICGYLSGESTAEVTNCKVENCTITGYRDVGGAVGYANGTASVTGNTVTNVTVKCDKTVNYKGYTSDAQYDVNEIIGETSSGASVFNNTATSVTVNR